MKEDLHYLNEPSPNFSKPKLEPYKKMDSDRFYSSKKAVYKSGDYSYDSLKNNPHTQSSQLNLSYQINPSSHHYNKSDDLMFTSSIEYNQNENSSLSKYYNKSKKQIYDDPFYAEPYSEPIFNYFNAAKRQLLESEHKFSKQPKRSVEISDSEQIRKLSLTNAEQSSKIKQLEIQLMGLNRKIGEWGTGAKKSTDPIGCTVQEYESLKIIIQKLQGHLQDSQRRNSESLRQLEQYRKRNLSQTHSFQKQNQEIIQARRKIIEDNNRIKKELELVQNERNQIKKLQSQISDSRASITEEKQRLAQEKQEFEKKKLIFDQDTSTKTRKLSQDQTQLTGKMKELQNRQLALKQLEDRLNTQQEEIRYKEFQIANKKRELSCLETTLQQAQINLQNKQLTLKEEQQKIKNYQQQIKHQQLQLTNKKRELACLQTSLKQAQNNIQAESIRLQTQKNEIKKREQQYQKKQKQQNKKYQVMKVQLQAEKQQIQRKNKQLNTREQQIQKGRTELEKSRKDFTQETLKMQESIRKNNIESNKLIERLKKQEGHEAAQNQNLNKYDQKIKGLQMKEKQLIRRVNEKKVQYEMLVGKCEYLDKKSKEEKQLLQKISKLQNEIKIAGSTLSSKKELQQQINFLKEQKQQISSFIKEQQNTKELLLKDLQLMEEDHKFYMNELPNLQKQINEIRIIIQKQSSLLSEIKANKESNLLASKSHQLQKSIHLLQTSNQNLNNQKKQLSDQIGELQEKLHSIRKQIENQETYSREEGERREKEINKLGQQKMRLENEIDAIINEKQQLIRANQEERVRQDDHQKDFISSQSIQQLQKLAEEVASLKELNSQLKNQSEEKQAYLEKQVQTLSKLNSEQQEHLNNLNSKANSYEHQLSSMEKMINSLRQDISHKNIQIIGLEKEKTALEQTITLTKKENIEYKVKMNDMQKNLLEKHRRQLKEQLLKKEREINSLLQNKVTEVSAQFMNQINILKAKKQQLQTNSLKLKSSINLQNQQLLKLLNTSKKLEKELTTEKNRYEQLHRQIQRRQYIKEEIIQYFDECKKSILEYIEKVHKKNERDFKVILSYRELLRENSINYLEVEEKVEEVSSEEIVNDEIRKVIEENIEIRLKALSGALNDQVDDTIKRVQVLERMSRQKLTNK